MRQVPLERDIKIAVDGSFWMEVANQEHPFTAMLISRSQGTCLIAGIGGRGKTSQHFCGHHIWSIPNSSSSNNRVDLRSSAELENDADLGSSGTKADTAVKGGGTQFNILFDIFSSMQKVWRFIWDTVEILIISRFEYKDGHILCLSGRLDELRLPRAQPQTRPRARTRILSKDLLRHKVQTNRLNDNVRFSFCKWLGEICCCSCLPTLLGPCLGPAEQYLYTF